MRIYAAAATREAMLGYLQRKVGAPRMVTFGTENSADVIINDARRGTMVRELKKRYEPFDLKGLRNIFHM
jgi:type III secretion system FlhB-like substrate exporter